MLRSIFRPATSALSRTFSRSFSQFGGSAEIPLYSSFKVYKTNSALDFSLIRAAMAWGGANKNYAYLKKPGGIKLTIAKENKSKDAVAGRRYDWSNDSQYVGLGIAEIGDLLAWDRFHRQHTFRSKVEYADATTGKNISKELSIVRNAAATGSNTYTFNLVSRSENPTEHSIIVTEGEFQTMITLLQQCLPDLLALYSKPYFAKEDSSSSASYSTAPSSSSPISE